MILNQRNFSISKYLKLYICILFTYNCICLYTLSLCLLEYNFYHRKFKRKNQKMSILHIRNTYMHLRTIKNYYSSCDISGKLLYVYYIKYCKIVGLQKSTLQVIILFIRLSCRSILLLNLIFCDDYFVLYSVAFSICNWSAFCSCSISTTYFYQKKKKSLTLYTFKYFKY